MKEWDKGLVVVEQKDSGLVMKKKGISSNKQNRSSPNLRTREANIIGYLEYQESIIEKAQRLHYTKTGPYQCHCYIQEFLKVLIPRSFYPLWAFTGQQTLTLRNNYGKLDAEKHLLVIQTNNTFYQPNSCHDNNMFTIPSQVRLWNAIQG